MAGVRAIQSVGESLRIYLQATYPADLQAAFPCTFQVLSSGQLSRFEDPTESTVTVTLYLYRATVSEHLRNLRPGPATVTDTPLPLELHWMLTVWSASAAAEHTVYAWAMKQMHQQPLLDASVLTAAGEWTANEAVQLIPEELSTDDLMRVWDALEPSYRLSAAYVARVVMIGSTLDSTSRPVIATRFALAQDADPRTAKGQLP